MCTCFFINNIFSTYKSELPLAFASRKHDKNHRRHNKNQPNLSDRKNKKASKKNLTKPTKGQNGNPKKLSINVDSRQSAWPRHSTQTSAKQSAPRTRKERRGHIAAAAARMLAVFDPTVAKCPEGLRSPPVAGGAVAAGGAGALMKGFAGAHADAVTVSLGPAGALAYSAANQSPLVPRCLLCSWLLSLISWGKPMLCSAFLGCKKKACSFLAVRHLSPRFGDAAVSSEVGTMKFWEISISFGFLGLSQCRQ